ncbi:Uncharacterised protein [Bordetella pertussis]|nr:Uncharacterised protein [Bordetella pertussis]
MPQGQPAPFSRRPSTQRSQAPSVAPMPMAMKLSGA